jgi:hypothetical protein
MGLCCGKPDKGSSNAETPLLPCDELWEQEADRDQQTLSFFDDLHPLAEESTRRVLPYAEALETIESNRCILCLFSNIADENVYVEWTDEQTDENLLKAPDGVFGSLCHCDPQKTLCHLACLRRHMASLSSDPSLRRTCGICNKPWSLIRTKHPGKNISLVLSEEKVDSTPAWRWNDIRAGEYWVRVQAGPGVASTPEHTDMDLPDAYTSVQVEIFDQNARRVNVRKSLGRLPMTRSFTRAGVGQFISWEDLRIILNFLEASTLS